MPLVWDPIDGQIHGHQPGTDLLMRVSGEIFGTTTDGQTFVVKKVGRSFHPEGRAGDSSGYPGPMRALADGFVAHAHDGPAPWLQEVIYDHRIWRSYYNDFQGAWESLEADDPHTSHVHWALTWWGAHNLTEPLIRAILLGEEEPLKLDAEDRAWIEQTIERKVDEQLVKRIGQVAAGAKQTVHEACRQAIRLTDPKH